MSIWELLSAGIISSSLISPIMSVIDLSIIRTNVDKSSMKISLNNVIKDIKNRNIRFLYPCLIINSVYTPTFCSGNIIKEYNKKNNIDNNLSLILGTSFVNVYMMAYKDRKFCEIFGICNNRYDIKSYGLFMSGAMFTVYGNFVYKDVIMNKIKLYNIDDNINNFISSIIVSVGAQIFSTPFHILGLDYYRNKNQTLIHRFQNIKNIYSNVCLARMIRVVPAFGIGSYLNDYLKNKTI
jgi:hypothetical protein